jgi:hypothetical protein
MFCAAADHEPRTRPLLFVIRSLAIAILVATMAPGQTVITDPKKIADAARLLGTLHGEPLDCDVQQIGPHFIFSLRLRAGYVCHLPLARPEVQGQKWLALTRITPRQRNSSPVYLSDTVQLPPGGSSQLEAAVEGSYWLGEGRYAVKFLMVDGRGDGCRAKWQIDARLNPGVHDLKPVLARGTVASSWNIEAPRQRGKPIGRLTILLHAASLQQTQTLLSAMDKSMLLDAVVALMDEVPAGPVRLVVFNLEQRREILRKDDFTLDALPEVAEALNAVQPATVDYSTLRNPGGTADFIEHLVNEEIQAAEPSGAVVFVGPRSIYKNKPSPSFGPPPGARAQFFYLVCAPRNTLPVPLHHVAGWRLKGEDSDIQPYPDRRPLYRTVPAMDPRAWSDYGPDSIQHVVDQLRGKTTIVDSAVSFADAVAQIAHLSGATW